MRAQVAHGEQTNMLGVKRLEELSLKSTELDRILTEMQQQLADQESAKGDILREYQVRAVTAWQVFMNTPSFYYYILDCLPSRLMANLPD